MFTGWFYSVQGLVSLFMPALMGIVADRWIEAQRLLSGCHLLSGIFMLAACMYGYQAGDAVQFAPLFTLYTLSVAFYMPTIALSNSVAYSVLDRAGLDTVKAFPPIRVFGTVGFIISMWIVDLAGMQSSSFQYGWSGIRNRDGRIRVHHATLSQKQRLSEESGGGTRTQGFHSVP